jgi:hypothetical protein
VACVSVTVTGGRFVMKVLDLKSREVRELAKDAHCPRYLSSGHLLYGTPTGTIMLAPFDLATLELTGAAVPFSEELRIGSLGACDIAVADNGTMVYASNHANVTDREFVRVDRIGRVTKVDTSWSGLLGGRFAVDATGQRIAFTTRSGARTQVWTKRFDAPPVRLTDSGGNPLWSPDGRRLFFRVTSGTFVVPSDGTAPASRLTMRFPRGREESTAEHSALPDGSGLILQRSGRIWRLTFSDSTVRGFDTTGTALRYFPVISSDGRFLAYVSDESGRPEVFLRSLREGVLWKRQISNGGASYPMFAPDSRALFYREDRGALTAVSIGTGDTPEIGAPQSLFDITAYEVNRFRYGVTPDGEFVFARPKGGGSAHPDEVVLISNVQAMVRRATGDGNATRGR